MEKNEGTTDRIVRVVIGLVIAAAAYFYNIWWLYLIALVPLATGIIGYCHLYTLLNWNTCKSCKKKK